MCSRHPELGAGHPSSSDTNPWNADPAAFDDERVIADAEPEDTIGRMFVQEYFPMALTAADLLAGGRDIPVTPRWRERAINGGWDSPEARKAAESI